MTARWLFGRRADRGRHTRGCGYGGPAAESGDGAAAEHLQYGPAGHRAPWAVARGSALTHHGRLPAAHGEGTELSRAATPPARHAACSTWVSSRAAVPCSRRHSRGPFRVPNPDGLPRHSAFPTHISRGPRCFPAHRRSGRRCLPRGSIRDCSRGLVAASSGADQAVRASGTGGVRESGTGGFASPQSP